jgi:hypothetical protein
MRLRPVLLAALVVLAACGGDDDDDASGSDAPSATEAQAVVDGALLDVDDLGEGWTLTNTIPAGEDDDDSTPIDECAPDAQIEANDLAETEDREFTLEGGLVPSQVQVSGGATADPELITRIHELLRDEAFHDCFGAAFESFLASEAGVEIEVTPVTSEDDVVDVDGIESTKVTLAATISAEGVSVELRFQLVVVSTAHLGMALVVSSSDGAVPDEQVAEWATLLGDRLTAA